MKIAQRVDVRRDGFSALQEMPVKAAASRPRANRMPKRGKHFTSAARSMWKYSTVAIIASTPMSAEQRPRPAADEDRRDQAPQEKRAGAAPGEDERFGLGWRRRGVSHCRQESKTAPAGVATHSSDQKPRNLFPEPRFDGKTRPDTGLR